MNMNNVGKTMITHPFENGLYHLFMVIWGMVYCCFTLITVKGKKWFRDSHLKDWSSWEWSKFGCRLPMKPAMKSPSGPDRDGYAQKKRVITDVGGDPFCNRRILGLFLWSVSLPEGIGFGVTPLPLPSEVSNLRVACGPFEHFTSQNPVKVKEAQSSSELERFKLDPTDISLQKWSNLQLRSIKFPWLHTALFTTVWPKFWPGHKRLEKETTHAQRIPKKTSRKSPLGCAIYLGASNLPPVEFLVTAMLRLLGLLQIWRLQALDNGLARVPAMGSLVISGSVLKIHEV